MSSTKVNCINCDTENSFDFEELRNLRFVKCKICGAQFNLFGIYQSLYKSTPLCQRIVDVKTNYSYGEYFLEASNTAEKEKIEENLKQSHFQELVKPIIKDAILFGNCFLNMAFKSNTLTLEYLDPTDLEFKMDYVREPPFKGVSWEIVEIEKRSQHCSVYPLENILHFKGGLGGVEAIGNSICGFWFTTWYFLRDIANKYPFLDMEGEKYKGLKEFRDFRESTVITAAGVPERLIFPWMKVNSIVEKIENSRYRYDVERIRNHISHRMERKCFPMILRREYEYENFPRLVWK